MILVCLGCEWPVPGVQIVNSGAKWRAEGKKRNHLAVQSTPFIADTGGTLS